MKDRFINDLQARFAGHEAAVDPGLWEAISGQLLTAADTGLQEVLRGKFADHEVAVDPQLWNAISARTGHGGAAMGGKMTWLAGGLGAAAFVGGLVWWFATGSVPTERVTPDAPPAAAAVQPIPAPEGVTAAAEPAVTNANAGGSSRPAPGTSPMWAAAPVVTATTEEGQRTVQEVMGALVEQNAAEPHFPDRPEPVPPAHQQATVVDEPSPPAQRGRNDAPTAAAQAEDRSNSAQQEGTPEPEDGDDMADGAEPPAGMPPPPQMFIPNVFSPQGDGINDRLKVVGSNYQKVAVRIISARTDAVVFKASDLEDQWNGRDMNNVPCEEGYYFYAIEVTGRDGHTYSMGEVIRLFR